MIDRIGTIGRREGGFTLLELLVVFVLVSLISTLLIQGLSYVLHLRVRFVEQQELAQQGALREFWFRSTLQSLLAVPPRKKSGASFVSEKPAFQGDRRSLEGFSLAPLHAAGGVPMQIRWEIDYYEGYSLLRYRLDDQQTWDVARWLGSEGGFRYRDEQGGWHDQWPPQMGAQQTQLPMVIELDSGSEFDPLYWLVVVPGQRDPSRYLLPFDI